MKTITPIAFIALTLLVTWLPVQSATIYTQPANQSVSLGADVTFSVGFSRGTPITCQWYLKDQIISNAISQTLVLTNVELTTSTGYYYAVVMDSSGSVTSRLATLEIDPTFTKITQGDIVTFITDTVAAAWGDYDGDGWLDVVLPGVINQLYHNNRDGTFTKITTGPIVNNTNLGAFGAWADFNNDGHLDLWIGTLPTELPSLFINQGQGNFVEVNPSASWIANGIEVRGLCAAWGDYDTDGFVDLAVNYYAAVTGGPNLPDTLMHNNGNSTFSAVTDTPYSQQGRTTEGVSWVDFNNDGRLDLFVTGTVGNDNQNVLLQNLGDGEFQPAGTGPLFENQRQGLGDAWGDFDNDGDLDVFVTCLLGAPYNRRLFRNDGNGDFPNIPGPLDDEPLAQYPSWADYDNDGYLDLFVTGLYERNRLFRNLGDGTFKEILNGSLVNDVGRSWQPRWADYDNDGFLDLLVVNRNRVNMFYHNNGNTNNWLKIKPVGTISNRSAIGAKIRANATIGGKNFWQMRVITANNQQQELLAHFGLGNATNADLVRIEWPSGRVQTLTNVPAKQSLTVVEPCNSRITSLSLRNGYCQLNVTNNFHSPCRIEYSSDLKAWRPLTTLPGNTHSYSIQEPAKPNYPPRFYRLVSP